MYRYLLFYYQDYYPRGGMEDCVLKTNGLDDLEKYVNENLIDEYWYQCTISYYDTVEDKTWFADIEEYDDENHLIQYKLSGWGIESLDSILDSLDEKEN